MNLVRPSSDDGYSVHHHTAPRSNHDLDRNRGGGGGGGTTTTTIRSILDRVPHHDPAIPSMRRTQSVSQCHDTKILSIVKPAVRNFDQQQHQQHQQQHQQRPSIDVFLKLARQREEIQALSTQLRQIQVESETTRKAFLSHIEASKRKSNADDETIGRLERENEVLRRRLLEAKVTAAATTATATTTTTTTTSTTTTSKGGPREQTTTTLVDDNETASRASASDDDEESIHPNNEMDASFASDDGDTAVQTSSFANLVTEMMFDEATLDDSLLLIKDSIKMLPATDHHDDDDRQQQQQLKLSTASQDSMASDGACRASDGGDAESMLSDFVITSQRNKKSISNKKASSSSSMGSRCQSEGLIVGFGGSDVRKNSAANLLSKMRANNNNNNNNGNQSSAASNAAARDDGRDDDGGGNKLNSSWGLIRPKQTTVPPPKHREHNKPTSTASNNSSQNSLWGLMRSNQSSPAMNNAHSATSNNNSSSQNALWGLLRPNQNSFAEKNQGGGIEEPENNSSQNSSWGVLKTNQPSAAAVPTNNSTSQNSLLGLIKSRSHQNHNNAVPRNTQVAPSSSSNAATTATAATSSSSQHNSSWGLQRSKSRAGKSQHSSKSSITEEQIPEDVPYKPPQNLTWSLIRRQQIATKKSTDDLRKKEVRKKKKEKKEREEEEANSNSNSSWGLIRSNHQSSPEFGNATSKHSPGGGLLLRHADRLAPNATWDTVVQAVADPTHPAIVGTITTQKIKFGSSGDDWAAAEDEDAEERIRRLVSERAARRKGRARSNSADLLLDPGDNSTPPLGQRQRQQQQQQQQKGMRKCSSSTLLERHSLERRTRTTQSNESFGTTHCSTPIASRGSGSLRNSLCPIPESRG